MPNQWQQKNFEANIPKGEFLNSGIDISLVTQTDADYIKSSYRIFCFKIFDSRAYLINQPQGGTKYLYDMVAGVIMWLYRVADVEFTTKVTQIGNDFKKASEAKELTQEKYLELADKLVIEAFNLECRLGWAPVSQSKIAVLLNDKDSEERIEAAMKLLAKSDEEDQKAFVGDMLVQQAIDKDLHKEKKEPEVQV